MFFFGWGFWAVWAVQFSFMAGGAYANGQGLLCLVDLGFSALNTLWCWRALQARDDKREDNDDRDKAVSDKENHNGE